MNPKNKRFSLVAAGNTTNPALQTLRAKRYELQVTQAEDGQTLFLARKEGREFVAYSAAELLGLVALWEDRGDDWNQQQPDILSELLEGKASVTS